jgi:microsomal dipeptidase-like Zn-dependent dipeptidase
MKRREFLKNCIAIGASLALGNTMGYANPLVNRKRNGFPPGTLLIDPHAHPDIFPCTPSYCDQTSTLEKVTELQMNASSFAGVGDRRTGPTPVPFDELLTQLDIVRNFEEEGKVTIVRGPSDLPRYINPRTFVPGALLAVEGATSIGTDVDKVDALYDYGVRLITPMHYMVNDIGDIMTAAEVNGGLTATGQEIVERMMALGIIVDVAHAHINTLQGIVEIAQINGVPIIDSHTSLTLRENPYGTTRLRTWEEMEMVAQTDGIVCTWPLAWRAGEYHRTSFLDWASENLAIAQRIGIEHIGLGTDGGGGLPDLIEGYRSILDLPKLGRAMDAVGFREREIAAYMGGNLFRVIRQCFG